MAHTATQHIRSTERDYARQPVFRVATLQRLYRRRGRLLAPMLGLIMYVVMVLMLSLDSQMAQTQVDGIPIATTVSSADCLLERCTAR